MGGFDNLLRRTVGTVGRVVGTAFGVLPSTGDGGASAMMSTAINAQTQALEQSRAQAEMQQRENEQRLDEYKKMAKQNEAKAKAEEAKAQKQTDDALAAENKRKKAVLASGRETTILAGKDDLYKTGAGSLLGS